MPRRNRTPKHEPFTFTNTCQTKRRYVNEKDGLDAIDILELQDPLLSLSLYRCERCGGWHLTRRKTEESLS